MTRRHLRQPATAAIATAVLLAAAVTAVARNGTVPSGTATAVTSAGAPTTGGTQPSGDTADDARTVTGGSTGTATPAGPSSGPPPSARAPGDSDDRLAVPDRSRVYERVAARAGCGVPAGVRRADGDLADWPGRAGGVNGTGFYAGGQYIWTDYPYDDAGTGQLLYPGEREVMDRGEDGSAGRISPLLNRYGGSAADVVEVRFAADGRFLHIGVVTNFLNAIDTTVVTFGFDVDREDRTGAGEWPFGAGLRTPGADVFVTAHPTPGGFCATVSGDGWATPVDVLGGAAGIDTLANGIEVTVPLDTLGVSDGAVVEVVGGSGLWDTPTGAWKRPIRGACSPLVPEAVRAGEPTDVRCGATDNDPGVFNLLFRDDEPLVDPGDASDSAESNRSQRAFQYLRQAEVLATGTSGPYALDLDLSRIRPGAPAEAVPTRPAHGGAFTRQYVSRVDLEGLLWAENDLSTDVIYLGRRQPYAVHLPPCLTGVPTCPPGGVPLVVDFHGGGGSHVNVMEREADGIAAELGERAQAIVLAPLGRGRRAPWWRGLGELDVLEAVADAEAAYPVDPDRRVAVGHSLGGYATLRMGSLYPDLWAGLGAMCAAAYENSTSAREPGNEAPETQPFTVVPLVGSLVNTPLVLVNGTVDPLVRITSGHRVRDRALAEGVALRYTEWANGQHCSYVPEISQPFLRRHLPEIIDMIHAGRRRRPAEVRYRVDPRQLVPGVEWMGVAHLDDIGVSHDGAWWVSGVRLRPEVAEAAAAQGTEVGGNTIGGPGDEVVGSVRAVSHALPGWRTTLESCGDGPGVAGVSGNDRVEMPPGGSTGITWPGVHQFRCQRQVRSTGVLEPVLELEVRNLDRVVIDAEAAGIPGAFDLQAVGDGPLTLVVERTSARDALGPCVREARRRAGTLTVALVLSAAPCQVAIT